MDDRKQVDLTTTDHPHETPSLTEEEEEKRETIIKRDDARIVAPSEEEEARGGINNNKPVERIVAPGWLSRREKRRIEEVARRVVHEPDGGLTEKLLLRLLGITRNMARWGFLSQDSPVHPYYLQLKDMEHRRIVPSEPPAAATDR